MALARSKTWSSGEVLTAAELNAEFNNILNNARDLISPLTASLDMNGLELILDADADTSITADTDDQIDFRIFALDQVVWSPTAMVFNEQGSDINFRVESDTNVNAFFLDAGLFTGVGAIGVAAAATDAAVLLIDNPALTATASTNIAKLRIENTAAITVPAGTTAIAASLSIDEPNLTATGTITSAVTLYIEAAPTEGGTNNFALWIDSGNARFDDDILWQSGTAFSATLAHNNSAARTYTFPNADTNIPTISQALTIAGPTAARTYTLPDADTTVAGVATVQTLTSKIVSVVAGTGTGTGYVAGIINQDSASGTGSPGDTVENDLKSYTIPANTLATDADAIKFTGTYRTAANATTKTLRVKFGATTIIDSTAVAHNNVSITIEGWILRTGATTQVSYVRALESTNNQVWNVAVTGAVAFFSPAETLSGAVVLKSTVILGSGAALNDVIQDAFIVEYLRKA